MDLHLEDKNKELNEKDVYSAWKQFKKENDQKYFLISNSIEEYFPHLDKSAWGLYIFYNLHADNINGSSYYSIENIAKQFNVTPKTITNKNNSLIDLGLISRVPRSHSSTDTYLLPTSNFILNKQNKNSEYEDIITNKLGYKKINSITLNLLFHNQNKSYNYEIMKRKYKEVTRLIYLEKEIKNNEELNVNFENNMNVLWKVKENKIIIYIKSDNIKDKDNISDRLNTLEQLFKKENGIEKFKDLYNEI